MSNIIFKKNEKPCEQNSTGPLMKKSWLLHVNDSAFSLFFVSFLIMYFANSGTIRALYLLFSSFFCSQALMDSGNLHFEKLTPIDHAKINVYSEALDFVFAHDDIKNVAITGPYGAGKSSVIESYKKGKKLSFLHISLAHFEAACEGESEPVGEGAKKSEVLLEGKILNQLLHQIDPIRIPQSHFKIKTKVSIQDTLKTTVAIILAVWLAVYFWNFSCFCQWVEKACLEGGLYRWLSTLCNYAIPTLSIALAIYLVFFVIYTQASFHVLRPTGGPPTDLAVDRVCFATDFCHFA